MKGKNKYTSKRVGKIASKLLKNVKTKKTVKTVAGSALAQLPNQSKIKSKKK